MLYSHDAKTQVPNADLYTKSTKKYKATLYMRRNVMIAMKRRALDEDTSVSEIFERLATEYLQ